MKTPTKKQILKLTAALRSGKYKKGRGYLQKDDTFCCLGVACMEFIPPANRRIVDGNLSGYFPTDYNQPKAPFWLHGLNNHFAKKTGQSLSTINDDERDASTFDEIADLLELVYVHKMLE